MATKPSATPRWAETAGGTPAVNLATPASGEQDVGYTTNQVPTSGKLNWLFKTIYDWTLYLKDAVVVADSGSGKAGIDATGDGAAPGGKFTPGGGGSPARGAINIGSQTTPSAPSNGDLWHDGTNLAAKLGNALVTLSAGGSFVAEGFESTTFPPVGQLAEWNAPSPRFGADLAYVRDTNTPIVGTASANRPGSQAANQNSSLGLTAFVAAPSRIAFMLQVTGNPASDFLDFYIDGVQCAHIYSRTGPTTETARFVSGVLHPGVHTFDWRFVRGAVASVGSEQAKIDAVEIFPTDLASNEYLSSYTASQQPKGHFFDDGISGGFNGWVLSSGANAGSIGAQNGDLNNLGQFKLLTGATAIGDSVMYAPAAAFIAPSLGFNARGNPWGIFAEFAVLLPNAGNGFFSFGLVDASAVTTDPPTNAVEVLIDSTGAGMASLRLRVTSGGVSTTIDLGTVNGGGYSRIGLSVSVLGICVTVNGKAVPGTVSASTGMTYPTTPAMNCVPRGRAQSRTAASAQGFTFDSYRLIWGRT